MKIGLGFLGRGEGSGKTEGFAATYINTITLFKTLIFSIFFLVSFLFMGGVAEAAITPGDPNNFIFTWDTTQPGFHNDLQINIRGTSFAFSSYNYDIYWENVASSSMNGYSSSTSYLKTIPIPEPGIYRVEIHGDFPVFYNRDDPLRLLSIDQWGDILWDNSSLGGAFNFSGNKNLKILATDLPNLSRVTNFVDTFRNSNVNEPIGWDISSITSISLMFNDNTAFNQPLNGWDTSNITLFWQMFAGATAFNQPLDEWNTSKVTNFSSMFFGASAFNQPLNSWNTSNVTNFGSMFRSASAFNQPLNNWDTSSTTDFSYMFSKAKAFDQDLSSWDISSVTTMAGMFEGVSLSQANQDATLVSWADQAVNKNITGIPLHIGVANYSATGSAAIQTLRGLGWTIDEQHSVKYKVQAPAAFNIPSYANQIVASGTNASAITVTYNSDVCTFLGWSDGRKDNPRQDLNVTTNIEVEALLSCSSRPTVVTQSIMEEISLTIPDLVTLTPEIPGISGGTSSGSLPINIKTNNLLGFNTTLAFSTSTALRHKVDNNYFVNNYVPVSSTTPDYDFNLRTNPHGFAFSIHGDDVTTLFKNNGSVCGLGTLSTLGHCWFNQSNATTPLSILKRSSPSPPGGATSTVSFRLDVAPDPTPALKGGTYEGVVVITVLPGV